MTKFADITVVDAHQHLYSARNIDALMLKGKEFGYSAVNVASLSQLGPDYLAQNAIGLLWKLRYPDNGFFFGGLEYHWPGTDKRKIDAAAQAKELIALGCDGIKMLEGKPTTRKDLGIALDSPMYDEFYAFLQDKRIPLLSHVADPDEFWDPARVPQWAVNRKWFFGDGTYVSQQQLFDETQRVLKKFPRLNVFLAHLYFRDASLPGAHRFMEEFPNACLDICPGIQMYWNFAPQADGWREFFVKYQDRLIYGTDLNDRRNDEKVSRMECVRRFLETDDRFDYRGSKDHHVRGIKLPAEALEKIYHGNFERIGCAKPRPVKLAAAIEFCRRRIQRAGDIPDAAIRDKVLDELNFVVEQMTSLKK